MKFKNSREKWLFLSSVPLRNIGSDGLPEAIATGCLVQTTETNASLSLSPMRQAAQASGPLSYATNRDKVRNSIHLEA